MEKVVVPKTVCRRGYCTNVSPPQRNGAVPTLSYEKWAAMAKQLFEGSDNPVTPYRLSKRHFFKCLTNSSI